MEKIKAIIFGVSEVLIFEDAIKARHALSIKFGLDEQKFKEYAVNNLPLSYLGKLSYNDFFKNLINEQRVNVDYNNLITSWIKARNRFSKINNKLMKIIKKLKKEHFVGIISNSTILNDKSIARKEIYKEFPFKIISYNVKHKQPDKEIYKLLINKLKKKQIKPEEILFIEHKEEYLGEANKLGMQTILFKNNKDLLDKLNLEGIK